MLWILYRTVLVFMDDFTTQQYLEQINPTVFDQHIQFFDFYTKGSITKEHIYLIDKEHIYDYSVTTFVHSFFPHFDPDTVVRRILRSRAWKTDPSYKYYQKPKREILDMWESNGKDASSLGTAMHEQIELFYNRIMMNKAQHLSDISLSFASTPELQQFTQFHLDGPHQHGWDPWRTELRIYDTDLHIAGSVDMLFKSPISTKEQTYLIMIDWKRSKEISYKSAYHQHASDPIRELSDCNFCKYSLQLNVYKTILEKYTQYKVEYMALGVFHPNQEGYQLIQIDDMSSHVQRIFDARLQQLQLSK